MGVGVSNPEKVGRAVGEICGLGAPIGLTATDDVDALIALAPDAVVHYGPTAAQADDNIARITRFLRAGVDVCSTSMTPWVWHAMHLNPPHSVGDAGHPRLRVGRNGSDDRAGGGRRARRDHHEGDEGVISAGNAAAVRFATGLRALNAVPAVNDLPPGWVTPLDLPLIAGRGTIR